MISLVGYTGFVGSNIYASTGSEIDAVYNSKNIEEAIGYLSELADICRASRLWI